MRSYTLMDYKKHTGSYQRRSVWGFTLLELLVVIAIIGLLLAVATPFLMGSIASSRLTMAGTNLAHRMSLAQQEAAARNQPVEMRFFLYEHEGERQIRAYQIFVQEKQGLAEPNWVALGNPEYLGDGEVVIVEGTLSPLFTGSALSVTAEMEPFASKPGNPQYYPIRFAADGSTQLKLALARSYFTLVLENTLPVTAQAPPNYYTIQLDPVTGRSRSYRP